MQALLISPEFEGIKTFVPSIFSVTIALLISPEFEGIKTSPLGVDLAAFCRY